MKPKNDEKPVVRDEVIVQQREDEFDTDAWKEMNNEEKILRIYKVRADRSGGELVHRCIVETPADVEQIMDEIGERIGGTLKGEVRCRPSMRLVVRGLYRSYGAVSQKNEQVVQASDNGKSEIIAILQMLQQKADADRERDRIDRLEREERERIAREKADERFQMLMKAQSDTAAQFAAMVSQAQAKNVEILMNMISTMNTNKADPVETLIKLRTLDKSGGGISDVIEPVMSILAMGMKIGEGQPIKEPDGMERILNILDRGLQVVANTQKNRMLPHRQSPKQAITEKTTEQATEEATKMVAQPTNDLERFLVRHRGTLGQAIRSDVASEYEKAVALLQMIGTDQSIATTPEEVLKMFSILTAQRIVELIPLAKGYETVAETIRQECIRVLEQTIAEAETNDDGEVQDEGKENNGQEKNKS